MALKTLFNLTRIKRPRYKSFCISVTLFIWIQSVVFVSSMKFSSRYNHKDLTEKMIESNRKYDHVNMIEILQPKNTTNKNSVQNLNKYVNNMYNYNKADNAFVKTRIDKKPDLIYDKTLWRDEETTEKWTKKLSDCVKNKGLMNCMKIFLLRRIDRFYKMITDSRFQNRNVTVVFDDLVDEIQKDFKWEYYKDMNEEDLDRVLANRLQEVVEKEDLSLVLRTGTTIDLSSKSDGVVLAVKQDPEPMESRQAGGGKFSKILKFLMRFVPFFLMPAVLTISLAPMTFPIIVMLVMVAGIINMAALSLSMFNIITERIFNNRYGSQTIYLNEGYKNEQLHNNHDPYLYPLKKRPKLRPFHYSGVHDEYYEEYPGLNEDYSRPGESEDVVYAYDHHDPYHRVESYRINRDDDEVERKETEEYFVHSTAAPLRRSTKSKLNSYNIRIRPYIDDK